MTIKHVLLNAAIALPLSFQCYVLFSTAFKVAWIINNVLRWRLYRRISVELAGRNGKIFRRCINWRRMDDRRSFHGFRGAYTI